MDTKTTMAAPLASDKTPAARFLGSSGTARQLAGSARSHKSGASDDTELGRRIAETHESNELGLAVKPVLQIIDAIFHRANDDFPGRLQQSDIGDADEKIMYSPASLPDFVEIPARITTAISYEIYNKCSTGVDVHTIVMDLLRMIRHYGWESKAVVTTVAFAVTFGEFRLCLQLYHTNPLAKSLSLLNQLHDLLDHATDLRPKLEALYDVIREIVDVNKKIVEFYDIPRAYFTADSPEILAGVSHIPIAVYWTIRSIVVSTTQILALTGMGIDYLTELWELSSLAHKLNNIKEHLVDIIERCYKFIARKKDDEAYEQIVRTFATTHIDNSKPMKVLFTEEPLSLYDCHNKRRVSIDDLRRKVIALFITDIDTELTASPEYAILRQMYTERRQSPTRPESQYEVVWVPVSESWTPERYRVFDGLREQMEWHSVYHPSVLSPVVIRFMKERWGFVKKPMLAVMDHQGRIVHGNAVHMMCIWGSVSYPFTHNREKLLWEEMSWTIDLLADNLEPNMSTWIQEGRYICLYGGDDIDWIRKFTRIAKDVARESGITLELIYAGKSKPKEKATKHIIEVIAQEKLSRYLDWNLIWYFWLRLESMWHSKGQLAIRTDHASPAEKHNDDPIMQGIIAMLSYGSGSQGWAVISRGFSEMVKGSGEHVFRALAEHGRWRGREAEVGFVPALDEHLRKIHLDTPHHCTSLILPATGAMPETVACAECGRLMERLTMFRCCLDS